MPRYLAIDWDEFECRYVLASLQKGTWKIRKAGAVSLAESSNTEDVTTKSSAERLAGMTTTLKNALKTQRIESAPLLLNLSRNQVEMLYLTLPPSPEADVPVMLKNQLLRELPSFSEYDPLDFLVLSDTGDDSLRLLALTMPLSARQTLTKSFRSIGRVPKRIGIRPLSAAKLVAQSELAPDKFEPGIVVDLVGREVDIILMEGGRIVSVRSLRLPEGLTSEESLARIADELERSAMIAAEGIAPEAIKKLYLFGTENEWTLLTERLAKGRPWEITVVDPFDLPGFTVANTVTIPEPSGRFASLLGLLADQQNRTRNSIDLLHPKEAPKPPNYLRVVLMTAVLLIVCGLGLFHWNQGVIAEMEAERAKLEKAYTEAYTGYQQAYPIYAVLQSAGNWDAGSSAWLDELRDLSLVLPGEQDLVLSQISFTAMTGGQYKGVIRLSGMVRDPAILTSMRQTLESQGRYRMQAPQVTVNPAGGGYPSRFTTEIYRTNQ